MISPLLFLLPPLWLAPDGPGPSVPTQDVATLIEELVSAG